MEPGFKCSVQIPYRGTDRRLTAGMPLFMSCLLEAALLHCESAPCNMAWHAENSAGFVLTNWQAEIYAYPMFNETVEVTTFPVAFKGVVAERAIKAVIGGGVCACANTSWVYMDLIKRRPVRPPKEVTEGYGALGAPFIERDYRTPDLSLYRHEGRRRILSSPRDNDFFMHINNVSYLEWAADSLSGLFGGVKPKKMKAVYKKECVGGEELCADVFTAKEDPCSAAVVIGRQGPLESLCEVFVTFN